MRHAEALAPRTPPSSASPPPVLIVGDCMLDRYWDGSVERISPEAPVPILHVRKEFERAGGAANVALNLMELGSRVTLATLLGRDPAGRQLADMMGSRGIQPSDVPATSAIHTNAYGEVPPESTVLGEFAQQSALFCVVDASFAMCSITPAVWDRQRCMECVLASTLAAHSLILRWQTLRADGPPSTSG